VEELLTFHGLAGGRAGGLLLAVAGTFSRLGRGFLRGLKLLGNGNALGLGGTDKNQRLGFGLIKVQDQLALSVAHRGGSEPGSVEGTAGSVEALDELGPAGGGLLLFGEVSLLLQFESQTERLLTVGLSVLVHVLGWVLRGADDLHLTTLGVGDGVELVGDDSSVGLLVVGDKVDGSAGLALAELSRGNSELVAAVLSLAGDSAEGSFDNEVTLDTSLVLLTEEWNLEGKTAVDLPGVDNLDIGLDGELGSTGVAGLHLSADGDEDRLGNTVSQRDTHGGRHSSNVISEHSRLLVVDLTLLLVLAQVLGEMLGKLLDGFFVSGEHTLDFIADVELKSGNNRLVLLAGLDVQQLLDLVKVLVLLQSLLGFSLADLVNDSAEELGNGGSSNGGLKGSNTGSSVSEAEEALVGGMVGDERVFSLDPLELLGEARVDLLEELGLDQAVGAGSAVVDGLSQRKNGASLSLLGPGGRTERAVQASVLLQSVDNVSSDVAVGLEPGRHSCLFPDGGISGTAVEEQVKGSLTDFRVLTTVKSSSGKDGKDLFLDKLVGDGFVGLTVSSRVVLSLLLSLLLLVPLLTGLGDLLEGLDSLDLDQLVG